MEENPVINPPHPHGLVGTEVALQRAWQLLVSDQLLVTLFPGVVLKSQMNFGTFHLVFIEDFTQGS